MSFVKGYAVPDRVKPWVDEKAKAKADERREDDKAAQAAKESGMAAGASSHAEVVAAAQATARKLGQFGAVTIDDVIREMERLGWTNMRGEKGGKAKNWKGSVFTDSEWACIGSIASRDATAKGRHVRQWALKSWLRTHPVNGTNCEASAFSLWSLYQEAAHHYPTGTDLAIVLGKDMLDSSFANLASGGNVKYRPDGTVAGTSMSLYGCVVFVTDGVGAVVMPRRAVEGSLKSVLLVNSGT